MTQLRFPPHDPAFRGAPASVQGARDTAGGPGPTNALDPVVGG